MKNYFCVVALLLFGVAPTVAKGAIQGSTTNFFTGFVSNNVSITNADFNNDNNVDMAVVSPDANVIHVFLGDGSGSFGTVATYNTLGSIARSIDSGDFNGDSVMDLVVANYISNDVSILFGVGNGTFGLATKAVAASNPWFIKSGDFNNDGVLDFVTLDGLQGSANIFLGAGNGTFAPALNLSPGTLKTSLAIADLNGDGNLDIVGTNSTNDISVFLGVGNGTFLAAVNYPVGSLPSSVTIADFNNDGKLDLGVTNRGSDSVSILIGSGTGSFAAAVSYSTVSSTPFVSGNGTRPTGIISADLNRDGYADLAIANFGGLFIGSGDVSFLTGIGDGTFSAAEHYDNIGLRPQFITTADFNGDGSVDFVTANRSSSNVSVFINKLNSGTPTGGTPTGGTPTGGTPTGGTPTGGTPTGSSSGGCLVGGSFPAGIAAFFLLLLYTQRRFVQK